MWIPNVSHCNSRIKLNKELLKVLCDVIFVIFISSFVTFIYNIRKKRVHKILCPTVKVWDIFNISDCIRTSNEGGYIIKVFW